LNKTKVEIVLIDAGCKDNTFDVARVSKGVIPIVEVKYIPPTTGGRRGSSYNCGAEAASGEILLFLRADSIVPPGYDETLRREMLKSKTVLTAFRFDFERPSVAALSKSMEYSFRIICCFNNLISSICKLPRGCQALAVRTTFFRENKFANDLTLMEDVSFLDRVRQHCAATAGDIVLLDQCVRCSSDDICSMGALKFTLFNVLALLAWQAGLPEEVIQKWLCVRFPRLLSFFKW